MRVRQALLKEAGSPEFHEFVTNGAAYFPVWIILLDEFKEISDYDMAILLAFVLACRLRGATSTQAKIFDTKCERERSYMMKCLLAKWQYASFTVFD